MAASKIITVFGATGAQGGSVVQTFLADPVLRSGGWKVRAVTRDVSKPAAQALKGQGAEVVAADLNDKSSLVSAMTGSSAVYAVTNYWEKMDMQLEIRQGKSLVDAAKETGVGHFIWSSLMNVAKLSGGKLPNVYHFDSKALVEDYARESGIPATFFMPGFYMSNLPGKMFRSTPDGWVLGLPIPGSAQIPLFDTEDDTGKFVKGIVLRGKEVFGKQVFGAAEYKTGHQIVEDFKKKFPEAGKDAKYVNVPHDQYLGALRGMGMPEFAAQELLENMRLMDEFGYFGGAPLEESHAVLDARDKLTTWEEYMGKAAAFKELK